jgi:hypothetical protein
VILHPGILALLVGSSIVLVLVSIASWTGLKILRHWDPSSSSELQLELERRTFLVSTLAGSALGFEVVAAFLFVFTVDDIHELFVGAMCATGSLNANPVGWKALLVKLVILVAAPVWMAFNRFDQRAGNFPIIRAKYVGLLGLLPLVVADLVLQVRYVVGLEPQIVTSCCGSLFSTGGGTVAGELASLPVGPTMVAFYGTVVVFLGVAAACLVLPWRSLRLILSAASVALLGVSLAAIVSFLSLYFYQLPTHHCPFDILQRSHLFVGYALYGTLFAGTCFGLLPGLFVPVGRIPAARAAIRIAEARWLRWGLASVVAFTVLSSWPVVFGRLTLLGYR